MDLFKKYQKGDHKYASYSMKNSWIITVFLYALSASIYIAGYVTTGSNKNLLTIVAVLGVLPASKALINAIMKSRVKTVSADIYEKIEDVKGDLKGFYSLYLTSYETNFYLAHSVITSDSLICYTDDKDFDQKKFDEHIKKHMKLEGIDNMLIKVFDSLDSYTTRLKQLNDSKQSLNPNEKMCKLLMNISL
ncbi:MAG: hypothetical protein J5525_07250 [Lachnospiraceae bacterium]|nr:hypothetical protein [Lachnospiraceae bacterium]